MNVLKNSFSQPATLYKLFFLLFKLVLLVSAALLIKLTVDVSSTPYSGIGGIGMMISGLFFMGVQFMAAIYAERFIDEENSLGLVLGLLLSTMTVASLFFPVGLLGIYSLLNKEFREKKLLQDRPMWLASFYDQIEKLTTPVPKA
jgi:hypothetical protein